MSGKIHGDVAELQRLFGGVRLGAAHHGAQPRGELAQAERLGDVVVGAAVETAHPVGLLAARGQHDDRQGAGLRRAADLATNLDPRDQRQHPVEQYDVRPVLGDAHQRFFAIRGLADLETLLFEVVAQQGDERRLILDDQHERLGHASVRPGFGSSRLELSPFGRFCVSGVPCTR